MKEIIIEKLNEEHQAKKHGYNWTAALYIDNAYCGIGKYFATKGEAEEYKKANA